MEHIYLVQSRDDLFANFRIEDIFADLLDAKQSCYGVEHWDTCNTLDDFVGSYDGTHYRITKMEIK